MWEITNADRLRWQAVAVDRLATLVRMAAEAGLPPLSWSVGHSGALIGAVTGPDADRVAVFELWAAAVGASRRSEHRATSGVVTLYAFADDDSGRAAVSLTATLFPHADTAPDGGER